MKSILLGTSDSKCSIPTILATPRFSAPVLSVNAGGSKLRNIAYPPFMLSLGKLKPRTAHQVTITSYGNRENAFGALHLPDGVTDGLSRKRGEAPGMIRLMSTI